jgi:hypothetical protein
MKLRNLPDATAFTAMLVLVFVMLMLGAVAPALLPTAFVLLAAVVLVTRFGGSLARWRLA